jgi:hypothetical protein
MVLPRSINHPLRRLLQIDARRRALAVEATLWLALARLGLAMLPFPTLARYFGTATAPQQARTMIAASNPSPADAQTAKDIGWAVTRAARYLPFRAVCLPQAMAARMMLARRGVTSVMHFGATVDNGRSIAAHAWLDAAGVEVTGYPVGLEFAEVACFV